MRIAMNFVKTLVFSNVWIVLIACAATYASVYTFGLQMHLAMYAFIACGTLCAYNLHWFLTQEIALHREREQWSLAHRNLLGIMAILGLACGLVIAFIYRAQLAWWYLVPIIIFTFFYTAPKIPIKPFINLRPYVIAKTLYLSVGWWYVTSYLPLAYYITNFAAPQVSYLWYRFLLILTICFLFDFRDKTIDLQAGIKSILKFVSTPIAAYVVQALLAMTCVALTGFVPHTIWWIGMAHCLPVVLLILWHIRSLQSDSDIWYYGILDALLGIAGMVIFAMALSTQHVK